jgi:hypothetical protein
VRHAEENGICVEANATQLKKKRDELKFRAAKIEIEDMLAAVDRGEIDMAYCDEVGFTQAHPNRSACTPVGECHASTAQRGKRLYGPCQGRRQAPPPDRAMYSCTILPSGHTAPEQDTRLRDQILCAAWHQYHARFLTSGLLNKANNWAFAACIS